ncbi:Homeodomain-like [Phytophthora cactorum]|nr:Homeodomain-like [Phytophthora cactorum]
MPSYTNDELLAAVCRVLNGEHAPQLEIKPAFATAREGRPVAPSRRAPEPALHPEAEQSLAEWVIGRQFVGFPAKRQEIIQTAGDIHAMATDRAFSQGWYRRFLKRHTVLAGRTSESISKTRDSVNMADITALYDTLQDFRGA